MIGILLVAHGSLGESLIGCAEHVLGQRPEALAAINFIGHADPDERQHVLQRQIDELDTGDGVIVLADVYGATPCNTLCRALEPSHIKGVTGANLPMLLTALNYRASLGLAELATRVVESGQHGIQSISEAMCHAATGR